MREDKNMLFDFDDKNTYTADNILDKKSMVADTAATKFETTLGEGTTVTGNLEGSTPICINGTLKGNIHTTSYLYISKSGFVEGDVEADHLVLLGRLTAQKVTAERLDITATGILTSDVKVNKLTVEEGGVLNGQITVSAPAEAPKATYAKAAETSADSVAVE